ncbi:hypothetical protein HBI26_198820 [Parastagonospora nodorum]|nr:hypothetical protein HBI10_211380 [Parastagonospora nodorum]KAH4115291.1 hypothetical protein HBH47_183540 [Parastagonospora nodorum]KAH4184361.1 hypothetical protein HBH42_188920 [Parastagonospora nodorum]KAH4435979.1 hypothetical protein HBH91_195780 [Parastagonospora nodorum]KAH4523931.1 hypothetical protein HBH85_236120 [Parastagonospora nodorum]
MHIPSSRTSDTPSATALRHRITMPMAGPGGARLPPTVGRTHKRPVYEPSQSAKHTGRPGEFSRLSVTRVKTGKAELEVMK